MRLRAFVAVVAAIAIFTCFKAISIDSSDDQIANAQSSPSSLGRVAVAETTVVAAPLKSVLIKDIPHVRQKPDFCGEACAEMFLRKLGKASIDQDAVFDVSGLDPIHGRGCYTKELATALKKIGFQIGPVWQRIQVAQAERQLAAQFKALHADLAKGIPSIICMHYDDRPNTTEHFRLIVGYDHKTDDVIYHEPAIDSGAYRRMKRDRLIKLWPLKYDRQTWTVIRMALKQERIIDKRKTNSFTNADYVQHILKLKPTIPAGFHMVIQPPFVVLGDESPQTVERRAIKTIRWSVDRLKKDYFKKEPNHIVDVWLFKDKPSYQKHTKQIFDDTPTTPFGYYSYKHKALIMNIKTGGGTLVHEIVHPFMASNFPECPSWFNEGLASLYEQCGDKNGQIYGYTNWRLAGLQKALGAKSVPTFKTLCNTTTNEFYREDPGTNYSQARYLCYYLQEQGLLRKYYQEFRRSAKDDASGYATLIRVLGQRDVPTFRKKWEAFVLNLRF